MTLPSQSPSTIRYANGPPPHRFETGRIKKFTAQSALPYPANPPQPADCLDVLLEADARARDACAALIAALPTSGQPA